MKTKPWAVALVILCTGLTSTAQLLYKQGAAQLPLLFFNWPLIGGLALYAIGAGILIFSLRGGDLSVLYPIIATSYVWVALLSYNIMGEIINLTRITGLIIIIAGISLIGLGSRKMPVEAPL